MLDKKSKQVLKVLNKLKDEYNSVSVTEIPLPDILLEHLPNNFNTYKLKDTVDFLDKNEYIECHRTIDGLPYYIQLLYKGANASEFRFIEFKAFLIKSIFVPILVAFITTFLVNKYL